MELERLNNILNKTFTRMFFGLLITAIFSYLSYSTGLYLRISYELLVIVELVVVVLFTLCFRKLSPGMASFLYYLYAIINGLTFGTIFVYYDLFSIVEAFLATSLLFGLLTLYGKNTSRDLSSLGSICIARFVSWYSCINYKYFYWK